jgi:hypothetical protein
MSNKTILLCSGFWKLKIKVPADVASDRGPVRGSQVTFSYLILAWKGRHEGFSEVRIST